MTLRKVLFVDRDGTLIREPLDEQIDSLEKLDLVEGVIPALLELGAAGYRFIIVTNQDGLGTASFPRERFEGPHGKMLELFRSQGIVFDEVLICPHRADERCLCRKPHLGLVRHHMTSGQLDLQRSCVVGDRETDLRFAENMGLRGLRLGESGSEVLTWREVARRLIATPRTGTCARTTRETRIAAKVDLDGRGAATVATGIGYFDHMLEQLATHGGIDLELRAEGDLHVDEHHVVEDCALALGAALKQAIGDKVGLQRYGFVLPMDEAQARVALDLSGRPLCLFRGELRREHVGELPTELVPHFFRSLCDGLGATLHIEVTGENAHHMVEATFKAVARALRMATERRSGEPLPSSKGAL